MNLLRLVCCAAVASVASLSAAACGPAAAEAPPPSTPSAPTVAASVAAPQAPVAPASAAPAAPAPAAEVAPPCVDGEIVMGTCLCPKGKGADATGHCVFMPCPATESGGTVFRDDSGQCMECRPGTKPVGNGKCSS